MKILNIAMRSVAFFFVTIFLMGNSCEKKPLPQYYFQCKVEGRDYIPNGCANCITCTVLGDTTFILGGNRGYESIGIGIIKLDHIFITTTTYILNENLQQMAFYDNSTLVNDIFKTDTTRTGQLVIKELDKINKIISGTFYYQAYNPIQNKTVKITNGEFRLKYTTY